MSAYDDNEPGWGRTAEGWWKFFAERPYLSRRVRVDRIRLSRRADAIFLAGGQLAVRNHGHLRIRQGQLLLLQGMVGRQIVLHILPHWNWPGKEGKEIDVRCFTNCDEVELFVNGASQGRKAVPKNSDARWSVKYARGELSAVGYKAGKVAANAKVETTGPQAAVKLIPDRVEINADGEDVSIITVEIVDSKGRVVPTAGSEVTFDLTGPGRIIGVGNGAPASHEPDKFLIFPNSGLSTTGG